MRKMHLLGTSSLALALALSLAGCGEKTETDQAADTASVVAKVDGAVITSTHLEQALVKLGEASPEQAGQAAKQALRSLIDQYLLAKKAVEDKLDADPKVVEAMENARRQILAQAYVQRLTADAPAPTEAEITDYHDKHPELFSERRIYRLQEISIQAAPSSMDAIRERLRMAKNLGDFLQWLESEKIPARMGQSVKAAEQLPQELVARLHQLKDGQVFTFTTGNIFNVVVISDSQTQPVNLEQARPAIERFLINAKKREIAETHLKGLKEKAKIEYLGDYADLGKETAADEQGGEPDPAKATSPAAVETK